MGYRNWYCMLLRAAYATVMNRIESDYRKGKITYREKLEAEYAVNTGNKL
jgi:hypothetical protein